MLTPQEKAHILLIYALALLEHDRDVVERDERKHAVSDSTRAAFALFAEKISKL